MPKVSEKLRCVKCGAPLEALATGRPPMYCGETCRDAAAYEIKRLNRRLESLENKASKAREDIAVEFPDVFKPEGYREKRLAFYEQEIAACEVRLSQLLRVGGKSPQEGAGMSFQRQVPSDELPGVPEAEGSSLSGRSHRPTSGR
jgi:hypothetical protein